MPIRTPPVGEHAVGENDHVAGLLLTVDDDTTEAVALDPWRRLTPDHRFVLSILAPVVARRGPVQSRPPRDSHLSAMSTTLGETRWNQRKLESSCC
jgi:hypothetical protein